jgi:ATP-binding protein involved in chromosome partitioning
MATETEIRAALASVKTPQGEGLDRSAYLQGVSVQDGKAYVTLHCAPQEAKALEPLRAAAEKAVKAVKGITAALVMLTAERPAGSSGSGGAAPGPRAQAAGTKKAVAGIKHIIAVASGKGGVGKSTTAVNLALALKAQGLKVGMLDADVYGPSLPRLLGLSGKPVMGEGRMLEPLQAYGLKTMSIGFLVEDNAAMIWRGPMVMSALQQMLREVNWGELDVLVVDMPPGTGDAQLTMAQSVPLAGAVIVSTPQDLALIDARRGIAMFERVEVPILGLIENMSYFLCPHCGERSDIFGHGGAKHEADKQHVPYLGAVPLHIDIRERSDSGKPVVATAPDSAHTKIFLEIAAKLATRLAQGAETRSAPKIVLH